ncbi:hypothetical protein XELAEV_18032820mg [Xenopus laevis]|uniref:Uncharacterized protein n=1 Tax=Xenopus laevis TaxID=8355 RepID=A0A974CKF2_XENLA|nr:hypothetical protein XELAEV_18032820mg [Xenopus laevis]
MSDGSHQAESGTQLLARLEGRTSLKGLEPLLFADEGCPVHGKHTRLIICGQAAAFFTLYNCSSLASQGCQWKRSFL